MRCYDDLMASSEQHEAENFMYLAAIGVLPEGRGKGNASKMMNPVLEYCKKNDLQAYLETG